MFLYENNENKRCIVDDVVKKKCSQMRYSINFLVILYLKHASIINYENTHNVL